MAIADDRRAEVVPKAVIEAVGALLRAVGSGDIGFELAPLVSGGNNRVFRVEAGEVRYLAKWYYHDAGNRDRAQAEFEFLSHLWSFGIRNVQRPIVCDPRNHLALYEFVAGRRVEPQDLTQALVEQAARLFAAINDGSVRAAGRHLGDASDACFTVREHIQSVDRRIERLAAIERDSLTGYDAVAFVKQLSHTWMRIRLCLLKQLSDDSVELPVFWRCLSPSDFGFHNVILRPDGQACFLDFEYAGWDDPAKMVGDFFSHPGVPVPAEYFEEFTSIALAPFVDRERLLERVQRLRAVSAVRWCCIMLNEFLPEVAERRQFADPGSDIAERRTLQLTKARALFAHTDTWGSAIGIR